MIVETYVRECVLKSNLAGGYHSNPNVQCFIAREASRPLHDCTLHPTLGRMSVMYAKSLSPFSRFQVNLLLLDLQREVTLQISLQLGIYIV